MGTLNNINCYYHLFLYKVKQQIFVLVQKIYRASLVTQMVKNLLAMREKVKVKVTQLSLTLCNSMDSSVEFSRPEYRSGQPFPSPGDLPNPGIEPRSYALRVDSLPTELSGKPAMWETQVHFLGGEDSLERRMHTHSSILAREIPWTEEAGYCPRSCKESDTTERLSLFSEDLQRSPEYIIFSLNFRSDI